MSDSVKRPSDGDTSSSKKRKPLDEISEDGPLTQSDVVFFQKEAIWRQMNTYKKQCNILSKDLRSFKHKYEVNELKLNVLDIWYEQIINALNPKDLDIDGLNESLLVKITHHSKDKLDDILNKRRNHLLGILSPIIANSKILYPELKELISQMEKVNFDLCELKAKNDTILKIKSGLEENIEQLQEKILNLSKESERNKSKTLERIDPVKREKDDVVSPVISKAEANTNSSGQNEPKGISSTISSSETIINKEELESLQISLKQLEASNSTLQSQLNDLSKKHHKSSEDCLELASRLSSLSTKDLQISPIYSNLVQQNKKLNEQLDELSKVQSLTNGKLTDLELSRSHYKKLIDETFKLENDNLKQQINRTETDLVRIRTSRDELLLKNTILKSQIENNNLIEELQKLINIQKIKLKESQSDDEPVEEDSIEKLKTLSNEDLIKRVSMLNVEIKEIEQAFQQTHEISVKKLSNEVENDNLIKKLTIEKTKADQKYFAAMRSKDALASENKVLKSQISKSQELIGKLNDIEKSYLTKIDILTKSETDFKTIKENSIQEITKLQEHLKSLQATKERSEIELKTLKKSFESQALSLRELEVEKNEALNKISKNDAKIKELEILLKKYRNNNTSSILQDDEKQLEALRSIAKCSLCSKNWKDTAITVCGHVFCSDCAQERLAARLRRCPSCNKGFSANDLLSIHL